MKKTPYLQLAPLAAGKAHLIPEPALPARVLQVAGYKTTRGIGGALATILERHGSAPSTPGQKIWVGVDGSCVGTVGGGAIEREILEALALLSSSADAKHDLRTFSLGAELGMCCGGRVVALLEPVAGLIPCLIVGGGHVATALAPLLARVGFAVSVVDAREAWGREGRLDKVSTIVGDYDDVGKSFPKSSVYLVMTHDHALDQEAIEWGLRRGFDYVGGIGSRAKAQRTRDRLAMKGFPEADVARVRMPLGISIGARLPDEIAISVVSELITWRRKEAMKPDATDTIENASEEKIAAPRVAAVVLAAGLSRRMGGANKLLVDIEGASHAKRDSEARSGVGNHEPSVSEGRSGLSIIARVVDALLASNVEKVLVVVGHEAARVKEALVERAVTFVANPDYEEGLGASLRVGISAVDSDMDGALVVLGDMPWIRSELINKLISRFDPQSGKTIVVPVHEQKRGHPVLWSADYFEEMRKLRGDVGARALLEKYSSAVLPIAVDDDAVNRDIDTPEMLADAKATI